LQAWLAAPLGATPYVARGHARFESPDGEVEGALELRVDPPRRALAELRTRALFGLVGERIVVSAPGDGWVLFFQERSGTLERVPFAESAVADYSLGGGLEDVLQLLDGRLPWALPVDGDDLARRTRVLDGGRSGVGYRVELPAERGASRLDLVLQDGRLGRLAWWDGGETRLEVEYDRWAARGGVLRPGRVRLRAPGRGLRGEMSIDRLEPRTAFEAADFEVGD
jgi:hypothetical protein